MRNVAGNLTMLVDFYELTMGNGYLKCGMQDKITYFDVFYRSNPDGGGYAVILLLAGGRTEHRPPGSRDQLYLVGQGRIYDPDHSSRRGRARRQKPSDDHRVSGRHGGWRCGVDRRSEGS